MALVTTISPMHKCPLGIHQVKLVIQVGPGFGYGSGIGQAAHSSMDLSKISSWDYSWWLIVDANLQKHNRLKTLKVKVQGFYTRYLEASRAPVHKLDGFAHFDVGNGCIHVLGHHISSVQEANSHVFPSTRVTLHHLILRFKAVLCYFINSQSLMVCLNKKNSGLYRILYY